MKSKYLRVYELLCKDRILNDDPRRASIIQEMRDVSRAATTREAAVFVRWYGWDNDRQLMDFCRKARKLLSTP